MKSVPAGYAAVVVVTALAAVLTFFWAVQRRLMYFPDGVVPMPETIGLDDAEPVVFTTSDGLELNGWFVTASGPAPRITILVFNGNAGNRAHRAPLARAFNRHGFHVMLIDYRGYGGNPGSPTEHGLAADGRAAQAYLAARPDVDRTRIVYFGESLGTAVAIGLAVERPPAALVLRSPFTSMADLGQHHYPFLPVRRLLKDRFAAIEGIQRIQVPMLVIAGGQDRIVPIDNTQRVYDAAVAPKKLFVLPDADHNDHELVTGDDMIQAVVSFLEPLT